MTQRRRSRGSRRLTGREGRRSALSAASGHCASVRRYHDPCVYRPSVFVLRSTPLSVVLRGASPSCRPHCCGIPYRRRLHGSGRAPPRADRTTTGDRPAAHQICRCTPLRLLIISTINQLKILSFPAPITNPTLSSDGQIAWLF